MNGPLTYASENERLGAMAERGEIDPEDAAHRLVQLRDGDIGMPAARNLVENWRMVRRVYERLAAMES